MSLYHEMQTLFKWVSYEFAFALTKGDDANDIDDDVVGQR